MTYFLELVKFKDKDDLGRFIDDSKEVKHSLLVSKWLYKELLAFIGGDTCIVARDSVDTLSAIRVVPKARYKELKDELTKSLDYDNRNYFGDNHLEIRAHYDLAIGFLGIALDYYQDNESCVLLIRSS